MHSPLSKQLPLKWTWSYLEDIAQILDGKRIPVNDHIRKQRISGKNKNDLYPYYGATAQVGWIDDYIFDGEFILLGEDGAPFIEPLKNKAYIVNGRFWVNNHAHILKAYGSNKFLCHFLNQVNYKPFVTGTTRLKLNQSNLKKIPIKLPPLPEQNRIVNKIEELFSELDHGIESLQKAQAQLKTYRQAVLKHAFEGKLTENWRRKNKPEPAERLLERIKEERENYYQKQLEEWQRSCEQAKKEGKKKPAKPKKAKEMPPLVDSEASALPRLASGWKYTKVYFVGEVSGGLTKNSKRHEYSLHLPFLRVANVYSNRLKLDDIHKIGVEEKELDRVLLKNQDLLVVEGNGSIDQIGRVAIWNDNIKPCVHQNHLIKVRLFIPESAIFILYWLLSYEGRHQIKRVASSTSGLNTLSISKVNSLPIPVCSIDEQRAIIDEIESRLSVCDKLEQTIEDSLQKAEVLRQSILKRAFEGKLVPQDPGDEPAEKLLERIRAEKAEMEAKAKSIKKKTRKGTR